MDLRTMPDACIVQPIYKNDKTISEQAPSKALISQLPFSHLAIINEEYYCTSITCLLSTMAVVLDSGHSYN